MEEIQKIPSTQFFGNVTINGVEIPVAVIYPESENPIRVIVHRELVGLITGNKKGGFDRYLRPDNLKDFVPVRFKEKTVAESTISFRLPNGRLGQGFRAEDVIDICNMYMSARTAGKLLPSQMHLAAKSEIIVFAFAKTGVIAVIDEATGFQDVRPFKALQNYLEKVLLKEYAGWAKRFPQDFFRLAFELMNWEWSDTSTARPSYLGKLINNWIYERLAPYILEELRRLNPPNEKGNRKVKHHQWLTPDIGHPKLQEHLYAVIALMKAAGGNRRKFEIMLDAAFPRYGATIPMLFLDMEDPKVKGKTPTFNKKLKGLLSVPPPTPE